MYLISRSSGLTMPLRDTKTDYHPSTGVALRVHPALSVQFRPHGSPPDWAKNAVRGLANWGVGAGLTPEGHPEDPFTRCGHLDTDTEAERQNWTPEEKEFVENALTNAASNGIEYIICSEPKTAKPWSTYDEFVGEDAVAKILYTVDLTGADPKAVLRYERENDNREAVIDALQGLVEKNEEDVVGVISV